MRADASRSGPGRAAPRERMSHASRRGLGYLPLRGAEPVNEPLVRFLGLQRSAMRAARRVAGCAPPRRTQVEVAGNKFRLRAGGARVDSRTRVGCAPTQGHHLKLHQRLDYQRLSDALVDRGMCEVQALREAMQLSGHGTASFVESIVNANLVGDWELGKVVAEIYNLPFLPLELCSPDPRALDGLDGAYLAEHGLVPLGRFGGVLTVAMPGLVTAEVLSGIPIAEGELTILPVVGSVQSNRRWIEQNLVPKLHKALPAAAAAAQAGAVLSNPEWSNLFDAADAAVLFDLHTGQPDQGAA